MRHVPDDEEGDDALDDFVRSVAHVDERPPPTSVRMRLEGTTVGRFKVISEIGRGGMGIVFLAEDDQLRRKVALKLLRSSFAADEERRRRFLREARAAAALSHPNLVTVYDVGEHDGRAYLAMEYLRGKSLREVLAARELAIDEAVDLARQVLRGLGHAHAAGLLHRDLKPENVLVGDDGRVRLLDFGLVKSADDTDAIAGSGIRGDNTTKDGLVMGTPGYMSPEQARGTAVDARTDVFSFGVLFYEMLTRERPFVGPTRADVVSAVLRDPAPRADAVRPAVGRALGDVVARCLEKAPEDRWPSTEALLEALQPSTANADETPPVERAPRASRWRAPVAALVVVAAAAVLFGVTRPRTLPIAKSAADGGRHPIAITEVPPPRSNSPEALTAYRQAMQAFRDADWAIAQERLNEAIAHDPELSAAYVHLAVISGASDEPPSQVRSTFSRAMATRANLSERDRALLLALEPIVNRDPADRELGAKQLRELANAHPDDAELWHLLAMFGTFGKDEGVAAERRAVELDPQYADAWQILASELAMRGKVDEALAAIDRCLAISPLTADCRGERARLYGQLGQCSRMEEDLRRGLSSNPRAASIWHEDRAAALLAIGRSDDTILEAFRQKWALYDADRRKRSEAYDRALLAIARGRFAEADNLLAEGEKAIELDPNAQTHARFTAARIKLAIESSRPKDAAKMGATFLAKKDVWLGSSRMLDLEIPMLRVVSHGGGVTRSELVKRRDEWYAEAREANKSSPPIHFWSIAYADFAETPAEIEEALAALPPYEDSQIFKEGMTRAHLGHVLVAGGRAQEAIAPLSKAASACNWLLWPIAQTRVLLDLGQAREAEGNVQAACKEYQRVLDRWGPAEKSITRDTAKARAKALSCGDLPKPPARTKPRPHPGSPPDDDEPDEEPEP